MRILSALFLVLIASSPTSAQCTLALLPLDEVLGVGDFGASLAIDGDFAAVGAPRRTEAGVRSGAVRTFRRVGGEWISEGWLVGSELQNGDRFGSSVAISGDRLVVGARSRGLSGAVHVFRRIGGAWVEEAVLATPLNVAAELGASVALEGEWLMIGAPGTWTPSGGIGGGAVIHYREVSGQWVETGVLLPPPGGGDPERFGESIDLDAERLVVGSRLFNGGVNSSGRVSTFRLSSRGVWFFAGAVLPPAPQLNAWFGSDVSISGSRIAVGARFHGAGGAAFLYEESGNSWTFTEEIVPEFGENNEGFGDSVSLEGSRLAVGSPQFGIGEGAIRIFEDTGAGFEEAVQLGPTLAGTFADFGKTVLLNGLELWAGLPGRNFDLGGVAILERDATDWPITALFPGIDIEAGDAFGASLATSGTDLLVGAPGDSRDATAVDVGTVVRLEEQNDQWVRVGVLTSESSTTGEQFGAAVAIDGDLAIVGAPFAEGAAPSSGAVSIFTRTAGEWTEDFRWFDPAGSPDDEFGAAVAVGGEEAFAGAPHFDGPVLPGVGRVTQFTFIGGALSAVPIDPLVPSAGLEFGAAVAASDDTLVVGAPGDATLGIDAGRVDIFEKFGPFWVLEDTLFLNGGLADDRFGAAVSILGDRLAVGAPGNDGAGLPGRVALFVRQAGVWVPDGIVSPLDALPGARFGASVSLVGDRLLVGEPGDGTSAGRAHSLERFGGAWDFTVLYGDQALAGDRLGSAVALTDGAVGFVGSPTSDPFGAVDAGRITQVWTALTPDCDGDGISDVCAIFSGLSEDCDGNGIPDACDLFAGTLPDLNGNQVPDPCEATFIRGDCNADGTFDIADAVSLLVGLFSAGAAPPCQAACDANDDEHVDIADGIFQLNAIFGIGPLPNAPYPACGLTTSAVRCDSPGNSGCP